MLQNAYPTPYDKYVIVPADKALNSTGISINIFY